MRWLSHPALAGALMRLLLAIMAGGLLCATPARATTERFAPGSVCHLGGPMALDFRKAERHPERWSCDSEITDWQKPRQLIRIDLAKRPSEQANPRYAEFDRYEFDRLQVVVTDAAGNRVTRSYRFDETSLGTSSLKSIIALPEVQRRAISATFVLDGGHYPEALAKASLTEDASVPPLGGFTHLLAAMICGLLIAPMLFDYGYWRALREPFPLYHALFCAMAFVQTAAVSGLIPLMTPIGFDSEMLITYLSVDVMIAATMLFAYNFIEPAFLTARDRWMLLAIAGTSIVNGLATSFWPGLFGDAINGVYFGIYIALLGLYFHILQSARRRGSRMAPYLIMGFAPFASIMVIQFCTNFFPSQTYWFDETWPQNGALLFEVVATALAVADRFISIKRERDKAIDEARSLEMLSERDELTGLLNRRALTARFARLVDEGFHAMALIDIDHFKEINDLYGHPMGDEVLKCMAEALTMGGTEDAQAFRIGGEEFLILLRGNEARQRAGASRRALTARTFSMIEGFERPVTASMGYLDFAAVRQEPGIDFGMLYTRADQLLYEAKCAGRNRTVADRLTLFVPECEDFPISKLA